MRDTIKESIAETIQGLTNLGIKTSFTEKELNELGIVFQEPEISAEAIKEIREKTHLSQSVFARLLNVSLSSVRQWEQGKRTPTGSAKILLDLLKKEPHIPGLQDIRASTDIYWILLIHYPLLFNL